MSHPGLTTNRAFRLCSQVVMEEFEYGALLMRLEDRQLLDLNPTAYYILTLTDGQRTVSQVAADFANTYQISETEALRDTLSLYTQLSNQGVIEVVGSTSNVKENRGVGKNSVASPRYIRKPDVILREEDPEGGFLINPDTNKVRVLNNTGLFIWQECDGTRNLDEIVIAVQEVFQDAPTGQVAQDVQEFVEEMMKSGFFGTVETMGGGV